MAENKDQVSTIAKLENQLSGVMLEIVEKEQAIAKLKSELEAAVMGEAKPKPPEQMELFPVMKPTPTPEIVKPDSTPELEINPEEIDFTGTISRGELVKHINENFPDLDFKGHQIGACFNLNLKTGKPKSSKLSTYESDYGFKYVGMFEGEYRFRLNCKP